MGESFWLEDDSVEDAGHEEDGEGCDVPVSCFEDVESGLFAGGGEHFF